MIRRSGSDTFQRSRCDTFQRSPTPRVHPAVGHGRRGGHDDAGAEAPVGSMGSILSKVWSDVPPLHALRETGGRSVIVSDNGPAYKSTDFLRFIQSRPSWPISGHATTPRRPTGWWSGSTRA